MNRAAAIDFAKAGARKLWAGTVTIHPDAKTGAHHHGALESVIYVVRGKARMRWGERLEFVAEAGPGDFIFVPPFVPHQEINASTDEPLECVLVRSDQEAVVVNLAIEPVEKPEAVHWVDPIHKAPVKVREASGRWPCIRATLLHPCPIGWPGCRRRSIAAYWTRRRGSSPGAGRTLRACGGSQHSANGPAPAPA